MAESLIVTPTDDFGAWPCEKCDQKPSIAFIGWSGEDETKGYCEDCLGPAVVAEARFI